MFQGRLDSETRTECTAGGPDRKRVRAKLAIVGSPVRTAIADNLIVRPASAAELAQTLDLPVEKVRYHLRRMRVGALVEVRGKTRRRGVSENLYSIDPRKLILSDCEVAGLSDRLLDHTHLRGLRMMFREAVEAVAAGTYVARPEYVVSRFTVPIDETGRHEAWEIHHELIDEILRVSQSALERLEAGEKDGTLALAAILSFGRPPGELP
jgi:DNA-binding transcriptional ArsR family regulator